ncbi:hypothetical protein C8R44DRAFT_819728 [Mycena epipterygia]|nr:hypothetical protein C8R44DRAFT_819728 [Mycena epipterygia]
MATAGSVRLPPELAEQVILDLRSEPKALANCALVCRDWTPAVQRQLFFHLSIHERNCTEIVQHLTSATARSNIAGYVKHLSVYLWGNLRPYINRLTANKTPLLHLLLPHISHFTNVKELEFDGCRIFHSQSWDEIWTDLLASGLPSISHLTVYHLKFEDLPDLVDLVSSFPQLTHLTVAELDVAAASHEYSNEEQELYDGPKTTPPLLENIKYTSGQHFASGGGPFLRWLAAGPRIFSTLHLDLDAEAGDVNAGVELLGAAGDNLKTLFLTFSDQWHLWEGLTFSVNSNLHSLVLKSVSNFGESLVEILESINSPLEYLDLGGVEEMDRDIWPSLVNVLMSPSFASLTKVNFYASSQDSIKELARDIPLEFPEFFERKIAFFSKQYFCLNSQLNLPSSAQTAPRVE